MTVLDEVMPRWDFSEFHLADVAAPPERCRAALHALDARDVLLTRVLTSLRSLRRRADIGGALVAGIERGGFTRLAEDDEEIVWGIVGRFWLPRGNVDPGPWDLDRFRAYAEPGRAKGAWNFRFEPLPGARCRVTTETRVLCTDDAARRRFRGYWLVVRPGSGLIRRDLLRALRGRAER